MKYGSYEWYLYHARENEDPIVPMILATLFLLICKGGIVIIVCMWGYYFSWAHNNNEKLNHDPDILRKRRIWREAREAREK